MNAIRFYVVGREVRPEPLAIPITFWRDGEASTAVFWRCLLPKNRHLACEFTRAPAYDVAVGDCVAECWLYLPF